MYSKVNIYSYEPPIISFMQSFSVGKSEAYLDKLDSVPVGHMTYGLAFHLELTKVLRHGYSLY